jgi:nitrate/nitrite transporter NarK
MQSFYYISMWGTVAYLTDREMQGTAYGIMTGINNLGTTIMPYVQGLIHDST